MFILAAIILILAIGGGFFLPRVREKSAIAFATALTVYSLVLLELLCLLALRITSGNWVFDLEENYNPRLFYPHPYLVAAPKPGVSETVLKKTISHNAQGFRGAAIEPKSTKIRVIALGGSTTYGVAVNDGETWPDKLQLALGPNYEVLNFGIPGQSTVEHLHFAVYELPQYQPDIVLLHVGMNDMHVEHAPNLEPDYANFHPPFYARAMGFCYLDELPRFAIVHAASALLERVGMAPRCYTLPNPERKREVDETALGFYEKSLRAVLDVIKGYSKTEILVPQVLIPGVTTGIDTSWWFPFLEKDVLPAHMKVYNARTEKIAAEKKIPYVASVDTEQWLISDFADATHLNETGNEKLARHVAEEIKIQMREASAPSSSPPPAAEQAVVAPLGSRVPNKVLHLHTKKRNAANEDPP